LFEAWEVIDDGDGTEGHEVPGIGGVDGLEELGVEQGELVGGDFLDVVAGQAEWEFVDEREETAEAIGAEAVGVDARACGEADFEVLFGGWDGIGEEGATPESMSELADGAVVIEAV
jgi:hypothetical protein